MFFKNGKEKRRLKKLAKKLHGRQIKYVVERKDDDDYVIGREGAIIIKGEELIVFSSQKDAFRCIFTETEISELLSLEGVILSGVDTANGSVHRTVIAYYTYYIK